MTRINLGVEPKELCDQMLVAEYKELPRMATLARRHILVYKGTGPRPALPMLGEGHMAYFLPYGKYLETRQDALITEMRRRGFTVNFDRWTYPIHQIETVPDDHVTMFLPYIRARIRKQIKAMVRKPTWTASSKPDWVDDA